jgi:hypothetical protein
LFQGKVIIAIGGKVRFKYNLPTFFPSNIFIIILLCYCLYKVNAQAFASQLFCSLFCPFNGHANKRLIVGCPLEKALVVKGRTKCMESEK